MMSPGRPTCQDDTIVRSIYRGRINWAFQERPYLEGSDFIAINEKQEELPGNPISVEVFYFECIIDDCGWGTVKDQPDFNASMESLTDFFKQNAQLVATLKETRDTESYFPLSSDDKKIEVINIYKANLQIKDSIVAYADQPKNWFLYSSWQVVALGRNANNEANAEFANLNANNSSGNDNANIGSRLSLCV